MDDTSQPTGQPTGARFFGWIRARGIARGSDRWLGGVCSGVARRLGWDPLVVRAIAVASVVLVGIGFALYGLAWVFLPDARDGRIVAEDAVLGRLEGNHAWELVGAVILFAIGTGTGRLITLVAAVALIALFASLTSPASGPVPPPTTPPSSDTAAPAPDAPWAWQRGADQQQPPAPGASQPWPNPSSSPSSFSPGSVGAQATYGPSAYAPTEPGAWQPGPQPAAPRAPRRPAAGPAVVSVLLGLGLVSLGALLAIDRVAALPGSVWAIWSAGFALVSGLVVIGLGIAGRRGGGASALAVGALILALVLAPAGTARRDAAWQSAEGGYVAASRDVTLRTRAEASQPQRFVMSDIDLDLTQIPLDAGMGPLTVDVEAVASDVTVRVPPGADVEVEANNVAASTDNNLPEPDGTPAIVLRVRAVASSVSVDEGVAHGADNQSADDQSAANRSVANRSVDDQRSDR